MVQVGNMLRRMLAVLLVLAMSATMVAPGASAAGSVRAGSGQGTERSGQSALFEVTASIPANGKEMTYAASEGKLVEEILDELDVSYHMVISAKSSQESVMDVSTEDEDIYVQAKSVGTAQLTVIINRSTSVTISVKINKAVYVNPQRGSDSNNGQSASVDGGGVGPLKTISKGAELLGNAGVIYMLGGAEVVSAASIFDWVGKDMIIKRYQDYDGAFFSIVNGGSLSLANLTIQTDSAKENNVVQLMENATLSIGDNVAVNTRAIFQMGTRANPIELESLPEAGTVYTLSVQSPEDGMTLVHTNGFNNTLKYFTLSEETAKQYYLALDDENDIVLVARISSGSDATNRPSSTNDPSGDTETSEPAVRNVIYLDGVNGKDFNSGASADRAVKTYEKAVELCRQFEVEQIVICGTVTITADTIWNAAGITLSNLSGFSGNMVTVSGGSFTLGMDMEIERATGICCNGGSMTLGVDTKVLVKGKSTGITVSSGIVSFAQGNIEVADDYGIGMDVQGGTLSMDGGSVDVKKEGTGVKIEARGSFILNKAVLLGGMDGKAVDSSGSFKLGADPGGVVKGKIALDGVAMELSAAPKYKYFLELDGFKEGDVVVSGSKVGALSHYALFDSSNIYWDDNTDNNIIYKSGKAVFLSPLQGDDRNDGLTMFCPVRTLGRALELTKDDADKSTIYIMDTVTIDSDVTIGYVGDGNSGINTGLFILPFGNVGQMFQVTGGKVTLGWVEIAGCVSMGDTAFQATAIQINGRDAVVETSAKTTITGDGLESESEKTYYGVEAVNGLLDMKGGTFHQMAVASEGGTNGQLKIYKETILKGSIDIIGEAGGSSKAPVMIGSDISGVDVIPLQFRHASSWEGREAVQADGVTSALDYESRFQTPLGITLEAGNKDSGETETSLYLRNNRNAVYWKSAGSDDNDGHDRAHAVKTFQKAWDLACSVKNGYIIICGSVNVTGGDEEWNGGSVTLDGYTWTPVVYQDGEQEAVWKTVDGLGGGTGYLEKYMIGVGDGCRLIIRGVIIDGNRERMSAAGAAFNNWGIYLNGSAQLELTGDAELGDTVLQNFETKGSTVYISSDASCVMNAKAQISENNGVSGGGINNNGILEIGGDAQISNNSSSDKGGGIYSSGTLMLKDQVQISDNNSFGTAGGIYSNGKLMLSSRAQVVENRSFSSGGGILAYGTVTLADNVQVSNNISDGSGGGIWYRGTLNIKDHVQVSGNSALSYGGGIYCWGYDTASTLNLSDDVQISDNSGKSGGGICGRISHDGTITINLSGSVQVMGNSASDQGGGIYCLCPDLGNTLKTMTVVLSDRAQISDNFAESGGGIACSGFVNRIVVSLLDRAGIINNSAFVSGGGISMDRMTNVTIEDHAVIRGNQIVESGDGAGNGDAIYNAAATVILHGGTVDGEIFIGSSINASLQLQGSGCKVTSPIVLSGRRDVNAVRVTGVMTDTGNTYTIKRIQSDTDRTVLTEAGSIIVMPGATITDASQYIQYFTYDSKEVALDKKGTNIVLARSIYIDGENGDDNAKGAGSTPANARKTLPDVLNSYTTYYICGKVTIDGAKKVQGSRIVRYTGFSVQGTPFTPYRKTLIEVPDGASLTLNQVALSGRRSSTENFRSTGYLIDNQGELVISGETTLTDNTKACICLAKDRYIKTADINTPGVQNKRITVMMTDPAKGDKVVEGETGNTNIDKFVLDSSLAEQYCLEESGSNLVLGNARAAYLDPENGSDDGDDAGLTPDNPAETLVKAHKILGKSGGIVYVMSCINVNDTKHYAADADTKNHMSLTQDNIIYQAYTEGITMFSVGASDGKPSVELSMNGITIDGDGKAACLVDINEGGTLTARGDTQLLMKEGTQAENNGKGEEIRYAVTVGGSMKLGGMPNIDGIIYLEGDTYIMAENDLWLSADQPLQLCAEVQSGPGKDKLLIQNTLLPTNVVEYMFGGFTLKQKMEDSMSGIYLCNPAVPSTIYVDGQNGDDEENTGTTPDSPVLTLQKAYHLLNSALEQSEDTETGEIVIVGTVEVTETTTLSGRYLKVGGDTIEVVDGRTVRFLRYGKQRGTDTGQEASDVESCKDTLLKVSSSLILEDVEIDGHAKKRFSGLIQEDVVTQADSLITVCSGARLTASGNVTLKDNDATGGQGGAICNYGILYLSGMVISDCTAGEGAAIYQAGTCHLTEGNVFAAQEIYLPEGKTVNIAGEQGGSIYLDPADRADKVKLARAANEEGTGESILSTVSLAEREELAAYRLLAEDDCVYMVKEKELGETIITLKPKEVYRDGSCISIDKAEVTGSTGMVTYTYYTDAKTTIKTGTDAQGGMAAYAGGAPSSAGMYYVVAEVEADADYKGAVSQPVTLTLKDANSVEVILRLDDHIYTGLKMALYQTDDENIETSGRITEKRYDLDEVEGSGVHYISRIDTGTYHIYLGTSNGDMMDTGEVVTVATESEDIQKTLNYYSVIYDANTEDAVTGTLPNRQICLEGMEVAPDSGNAGKLSRTGYALKGWAVNSDGESVESMTVSSQTHVFYAVWSVCVSKIKLDSNGGEENGSVTATYGRPLPEFSAPTKVGYTVIGYFTSPEDGALVINPDGTLVAGEPGYTDEDGCWISVQEQVTLYAHWQQEEQQPIQTPTIPVATQSVPPAVATDAPLVLGTPTIQETPPQAPQTPLQTPPQAPQTPLQTPPQAPQASPQKTPEEIPPAQKTSTPGQTPCATGKPPAMSDEEREEQIEEAKKDNWVGADVALIDDEITSNTTDDDIECSVFALLNARVIKCTKTTEKVVWNKLPEAAGYIIYANQCGPSNGFKKIKTVGKSRKKYIYRKLHKGKYYKYIVVAYQKVKGRKTVLSVSKTVHATTKGGKYGVAKTVKLNRSKVALKVGQTFQIKAKEVKEDKKIQPHRMICFESDGKRIATAKKGLIKAKKQGTCHIYVYAQNGAYKKVKVTVK